jgi:hypothetical protein
VEDAVLLVALDGARIDYTRVGEGGLGLRFVGNDHETLLRHEVEGWDAEGTSFIWVHVPSVAQGTRFFMYYDGPDEPAPFGIGDVWPPAYGAVWHMSDGGLDATLNANTADGVVDEVPGQIGPGAATPSDGGTGYVVGAAAGVNNLFGTGGTFSAWVRPAGFDALGQDVVAMKAELSSGDGGWALVLDGDADSFAFSRGYAMQRRITWTMVDAVPLAAWVHVAVIYDDSAGVAGEATFVVNGATAATQRTSNGNPSNPADGDAAQALQIATELVGRFDEVRVRSGGTVTDAILDYRSQTDQLLEYGPLDISGCFADPG